MCVSSARDEQRVVGANSVVSLGRLARMTDRLFVSAVGTVVEIDDSRRDIRFRQRVRAAWTDARHVGSVDPEVIVEVGDESDEARALSQLSTDVTIAALAQRRHDPVWMLHAAGLADGEGRVVVLSAPSGTGKTTAARHLSRRYAYVSDETVGIEADGRVVPYRKPLSVIEHSAQPKAQVSLSSLDGGRPLPEVLRVAKIVVIDRSADGPETPQLEPLDLVEALELLGPQTSYLCDGEAPLHRIAALLNATGGAVRLRYREVADIDDLIAELFLTEARTVEAVPDPARDDVLAPETAAGFVRAEVVDALAVDDRLALLRRTPTGGQVHVLDGIGPTVWLAASGRSAAQIIERVIAEHGAPQDGDAHALVEDALRRLTADGLLVQRPEKA